jgi:hypothetical protein
VSEPASWLTIERGWRVEAADGAELGKVEETVGDSSRDIFNGITVGTGLLSRPRYVPAERVAEISTGVVRLSMARDEFERLGHYDQPPPSEQIRPD